MFTSTIESSFLEEQIQEATSIVSQNNLTSTTTGSHWPIQQHYHADNDNKNQDEDYDEEEDIRQLAASLAPAVEELDALLASPGMDLSAHLARSTKTPITRHSNKKILLPTRSEQTFSKTNDDLHGHKCERKDQVNKQEEDNNYYDDDDDDDDDDESFNDELQHLATAELLLRQELEFAQDFGVMMNSPIVTTKFVTVSSTTTKTPQERNLAFQTSVESDNHFGRPRDPIPMPSLFDNHEDDDDDDDDDDDADHEEDEVAPTGSLTPLAQHVENQHDWRQNPDLPGNGPKNIAVQYQPVMNKTVDTFFGSPTPKDTHRPGLDRLYVDTNFEPDHIQKMINQTMERSPPTSPRPIPLSKTHNRHDYTLSDHSHHLKIQTEERGGWYCLPLLDLDPTVKEYIIPLFERDLDHLYVGLHSQEQEDLSVEKSKSKNKVPQNHRSLPLRTVAIKIRPDVLVGAIMDAIMHALEDYCEVQKRQGGHLILTTEKIAATRNSSVTTVLELDFQVVSYKGTLGSRFCERTLMMRVFYCPRTSPHYNDHERASSASLPTSLPSDEDLPDYDYEGEEGNADISETASIKLKEAAALVQKLELSKQGASDKLFGFGFFGSRPVYPSKQAMQEAIANQLLKKYKPCESVQTGILTLPALSDLDWPWVQYSHKFIAAIWAELEDRGLSYASLCVYSFGQFPALPTLDVHYCSQLRRLTREVMVVALLRSASELEQYAREAEYICANLIQVLKPCFELYKLDPPSLPQPLPLTAYPLEFTPHQDICPPWGQKVMEALNEVTAISSDSSGDKSFDRAEKAVQLVLDAFQKQHDEEQSARLGRKNVQVMDRLAKMQAHKQASVDKLHQAYTKSAAAKKAADEFHRYAVKAGSDLPETEQVPLFKCSILVGSSTGSVFITSTQIMLVTQFIPIVGENTIVLLDLAGLEFSLHDASTSLLNPLPAGISVCRGGAQIVLFRPSYSASRLLVFLEIVQGLGEPHPKVYVANNAHGHNIFEEDYEDYD